MAHVIDARGLNHRLGVRQIAGRQPQRPRSGAGMDTCRRSGMFEKSEVAAGASLLATHPHISDPYRFLVRCVCLFHEVRIDDIRRMCGRGIDLYQFEIVGA